MSGFGPCGFGGASGMWGPKRKPRGPMSPSTATPRNARRRKLARNVCARLKTNARALACRRSRPAAHVTRNPTKGRATRSVRIVLISAPPLDPEGAADPHDEGQHQEGDPGDPPRDKLAPA